MAAARHPFPRRARTEPVKAKGAKTIGLFSMMPGNADLLKQMEDELVALKKKPVVNSIAGDRLLLARAPKETEEQWDRKNSELKANLQNKVEARGFLVKQQQATREELIVEHERLLAMHDKQLKL